MVEEPAQTEAGRLGLEGEADLRLYSGVSMPCCRRSQPRSQNGLTVLDVAWRRKVMLNPEKSGGVDEDPTAQS